MFQDQQTDDGFGLPGTGANLLPYVRERINRALDLLLVSSDVDVQERVSGIFRYSSRWIQPRFLCVSWAQAILCKKLVDSDDAAHGDLSDEICILFDQEFKPVSAGVQFAFVVFSGSFDVRKSN